jgi:outer membrane protein OmpA-like peptidoglycan-associated protein
MRRRAVLAATVLLAGSVLASTIGLAQTGPSTEQIIKSLTPTAPSGATRGLRLGPATAPPTAPPAEPPAPPPAAAPAPSISLTVQFANGSARLTPQAIEVLDNLGRALSDKALAAYRFRIEGHTDTVGSHDYNKALSDRRAAAVVDYLALTFHIDRGRMEAIGMGEDRPLIPTPDQTAEPRNRRVEVVNIGT